MHVFFDDYSVRNVADIMDTEEQEDQKIRMNARDALDKVSGKFKVCNDFHLSACVQQML